MRVFGVSPYPDNYEEKCMLLNNIVSENGKYPYRLASLRLWDMVECMDLMKLQPTDVVLEIGAWNNYTPFALESLVKKVYATDNFSWAERDYAKDFSEMNMENGTCSPERWIHEFDGHENIIAEQADARMLQYPDAMFDKIYSISVIEHFPQDVVAFNEIYRVLKPGGVFVFTTEYNPLRSREFSPKTGYFRIYTSDMLIELIRKSPFELSGADLKYLIEAKSIDDKKLPVLLVDADGKDFHSTTISMELKK